MKFTLIQVFRGAAAMLVIMHHLIANTTNHLNYVCYNNFFNFGFIGVDFFFVLSGFIITYVHFKDLTAPIKGSAKKFFLKRFIRIYPIYWFVAIITFLIYLKSTPVFMSEAGLTMDLTSPLIWKFLCESFLLIPNETMRLVGAAWTLSYELIFYIIFGICITTGFKSAKIVAIVWVALILAYCLLSPYKTEYLSFLFHPLIFEFLFGCMVAYFIRKEIDISLKYTLPLITVLLVLLLKNIHIEGLVFHRDLLNVTVMGLFFATLTYITVQFDQINTTVKFPSLLILIGDASYSIYLSHNMFLSALCKLYAKLNPNFGTTGYLAIVATVIFIITVFVGIIIHLFIEKKMLKYINEKVFATRIEAVPAVIAAPAINR